MSNIDYSLNNKGVRLLDSKDAWIVGKNGKPRLNPDYRFIRKIEMSMPNMVLTAGNKNKPRFKSNVCDLNNIAKSQIVDNFYNSNGKRNKKSVAYLVQSK